jgi:hypothetical protein
MKTFLRKLKKAAGDAYATAGARLTVYLQTEPVRARSAVVAALVSTSTVIPGFASHRADEVIAGALVSVATLIAGESARMEVAPVDKK